MITSREVVLPSLNRAMEMCESRVYEIYKKREGFSPVEQELHMREVRKLMKEYRDVREWIREIDA
jgi:hypothetical protein